MEALRRYYESVCYGRRSNDSEIARLIYDKWREFQPRPHKKGRTFSSEWAIRYRLPKVRELIWKEEQFERHCGLLGLIDPDEIYDDDLPRDEDGKYDLGDFVYEPDEY